MKKTFTTLAAVMLLSGASIPMQAQDFVVPEATLTVPLDGKAELLYNMFQVTWGYYELVENADPITSSLTMPDGTVKTVKGKIDSANMEGTQTGTPPSTVNNALMFRNFMDMNDDMQLIQENGTYKVYIPEGVVLVNGVPNPEANLEFTITGEQEVAYMEPAIMVYPSSQYSSFASAIQMTWQGQEIYFVEDVDSVALDATIDGQPINCKAYVREVQGGNEDGTGAFSMFVLYILFDDFISYNNGTYLNVEIPEGLVANAEGEVNPLQTVELVLMPQIQGSLSPAQGSELPAGDAYVTVSWDGINLQPLKGSSVTARNSSTGNDQSVDVTFGDDASITIDLSKLASGVYEIIIPEAFVTILTQSSILDTFALNSELFATYTIVEKGAGIESLTSEKEFSVYSIDGKNLHKNVDASTVNGLKPGLYIINGKKTFIK